MVRVWRVWDSLLMAERGPMTRTCTSAGTSPVITICGRQVDKLHGHMQANFGALLTADGKPQGQRQEQRQEFEALMTT